MTDATGTDALLTPRQEEVLQAVVERHIASGQPVGSKNIAGRDGLDWASSTIRNELHRLEDLGYLDHPHTSAGRVPTWRGASAPTSPGWRWTRPSAAWRMPSRR